MKKRILRQSHFGCCPELLAGLPVPRPACNIHGGDGFDVLNKKAQIIGIDGQNYTQRFLTGAKLALKIVLDNNVKKVYLKNGSPTCGCNKIYSEDGSKLIDGIGVFAALLKENSIEVIPV